MKITRRQLRNLISEHMLSPTFWLNREKRMTIRNRVMNDPNVHPKIKDLLKSGDEAQVNQAVELLIVLNPEYAEEIQTYASRQDSIEYAQDFRRAQLNPGIPNPDALSETIFAGGPTVEDPDAKGVTVDMAKQSPPIYRPQRDRDEEIRRTADPRIVNMLDSDSEEDKQMARTLASTLDGKPEAYETLTPEEREAQSLFDEFYPEDIFDEPHDTEDGRLKRSYAPEIKQIRDTMKKRLEDATAKGINSYDELFSIAYSTPGYDNLRKHIMQLPSSEFAGATGVYGDEPGNELMYMPGQLVDMYMIDDDDYY